MIVGAILFAVSIISASVNLTTQWNVDRLFSTIITSPLLIIIFCSALFHWVRGINILYKELKNEDIAK